MSEATLAQWNQFLTNRPDAHLLQTGEWGELKKDFGWRPVRVIVENFGAQILFRKLPLGLTIAYIPKLINDERRTEDSKNFWNEVDSICKKNKAVFLKLEPDAWQDNLQPSTCDLQPDTFNLTLSTRNIQPPRTIVLDLQADEETLLARMKPKCRYNVRLAQKKGVTVRVWDDLSAFHEMMTITGGRDGFGVHSEKYYQRAYELFHAKGTCELLLAEYENKPLAALMVFANGKRAWYVYGASNNEERNRMPTYLLQWEAMRWAKARGCEDYDLWGVPDEDEATLEAQFESRHDGLWGVYRFKRGFGGEVKRAAQALDKVYNPLLYWAYLKFMGSKES
ncbi:MAG: peptidoglycan bridge formation glycyltransferase FemA/FemB family protein [Anaerolineales bacterium]|nr:peptidoglycan bridge formation glycyltransferase FemA/FemB family protein [Anaerolineales bacterium]